MKQAAGMGSCAMTLILSFINTGSGIQKVYYGGHTDTQTVWRSHKPTFIFPRDDASVRPQQMQYNSDMLPSNKYDYEYTSTYIASKPR
jgi:hypothetical protein